MRPEPQRPRRSHPGILLPQRPGGSIARIGKNLAPRLRLRPIQRGKIRPRHIDLAANLENVGAISAKHLRNITNKRHVGRHILAHLAIAARRRAHQPPALIAQRAREPVDLVLHRHRHRRILGQRQKPPHPRDKFPHLVIGKRIVEAHHPHRMANFGQRRRRHRMPHGGRRRIRPHQMRKRRLQLGIAPHQRVIFGVGHLRRIIEMIEPVGAVDRLGQPHQFIGGFGFGGGVAHAIRLYTSAKRRQLHRAPQSRAQRHARHRCDPR